MCVVNFQVTSSFFMVYLIVFSQISYILSYNLVSLLKHFSYNQHCTVSLMIFETTRLSVGLSLPLLTVLCYVSLNKSTELN